MSNCTIAVIYVPIHWYKTEYNLPNDLVDHPNRTKHLVAVLNNTVATWEPNVVSLHQHLDTASDQVWGSLQKIYCLYSVSLPWLSNVSDDNASDRKIDCCWWAKLWGFSQWLTFPCTCIYPIMWYHPPFLWTLSHISTPLYFLTSSNLIHHDGYRNRQHVLSHSSNTHICWQGIGRVSCGGWGSLL